MEWIRSYGPGAMLTAAAIGVALLVDDAPGTAIAVVVAAAAWAVSLRRALGGGVSATAAPSRTTAAGGPDEDPRTAIREGVCAVVDRVNDFINEEVDLLQESLQQIEQLAKDAVARLQESLVSLNHQVKSQSTLLHQLTGISVEAGSSQGSGQSWGRVIDDSASVIEYFIGLLDDVDRQRAEVSEGLDALVRLSEELRDGLGEVAGSGSPELRMTVSKLKALAQRQAAAVASTPRLERERSDATQAMGRIDQARRQLGEMRDVVVMNTQAFERQSSEDMGKAVRSLQFEDIVTQLVAGAQNRLDEMNRLVETLSGRVEYLKLIQGAGDVVGTLEVVERIHSDVESFTERMRRERHRPVSQSSLDEGSVELF